MVSNSRSDEESYSQTKIRLEDDEGYEEEAQGNAINNDIDNLHSILMLYDRFTRMGIHQIQLEKRSHPVVLRRMRGF